MALTKNPLGPLPYAALYQINDVIWFDKTRPVDIDPEDDDEALVVTNSDRLDLIAFNRLGSAQLGWVILHRNNMRLAPNDLVPGMKIYIPSRASLQRRGILNG
jgi:hypothetical protein